MFYIFFLVAMPKHDWIQIEEAECISPWLVQGGIISPWLVQGGIVCYTV